MAKESIHYIYNSFKFVLYKMTLKCGNYQAKSTNWTAVGDFNSFQLLINQADQKNDHRFE